MTHLIDKKIGNEIEGEIISDLFEGYVFKVTGGIDRDGFGMKNGVLTTDRRRLLLKKGSQGIRFRKAFNRTGSKVRKLVRGCIVSPEIKMLNLKIVKIGGKVIPGLTNPDDAIPKRLAPKVANNILKEFGLLEIYNKKKQNSEERKTLRYMITKFANKREVKTKNGKVYAKKPKIQRLITPLRLRRKRVMKKMKEDSVKYTVDQKKSYEDSYKKLRNNKKGTKNVKKVAKKVVKA
jgi:small subunit ribosomal protein S6e